jgi:menaquinol-cytochrome c reductase iron-sulfur subunit
MSEEKDTRRTFHHRIIYGIWAVIGTTLALPSTIYLLFPFHGPKRGHWVDAGSLADLAPNEPKEVSFQRTKIDGWKVRTETATAWVVATPEQRAVAFSPLCTHLGCAYHWEKERNGFLCPCHNSLFAIDGRVITGPSPRPLDRYEVRVEGERLWLGALTRPEGTGQ